MKLFSRSLVKVYAMNKPLIWSFGFLLVYSTAVVFAAPPTSPYTPTDNITNPSCAPGDTNCFVSLVGTQLGDFDGTGNETYIDVDDANFTVAMYSDGERTFYHHPLNNSSCTGNEIFIGFSAGDNTTTGVGCSTFISAFAGENATAALASNFMGYSAGRDATNATRSNFFGASAGRSATNADRSNFFGEFAGINGTNAAKSNFIGWESGRDATNASFSTFVGYRAGRFASNANDSIFIGREAGNGDAVNNSSSGTSILIGNFTSTGGFSNSVAIGRGTQNSAARQLNIGNVLYATGIYNSDTPSASPISGGKVGIGVSAPGRTLDLAFSVDTLRNGQFSTGNVLISSLDEGMYFGGVGVQENQWGLNNYGNVWTAKDSNRDWTDIVMSSNGKIQTAVVSGGQIYVSADYGETWTAKDSPRNWSAVAMSSNGKIQTAIASGEQIYVSTDYGNTWTAKDSNRTWNSVSMSSDGKIQVAGTASFTGDLYISTDYGNTWTAKGFNNALYQDIAMSSDGKIQIAAKLTSGVIISTDYGSTWSTTSAGSRSWNGVAMSSDGKIQTAVASSSQIYVSTDYGNTWTAKNSSRGWTDVSMSSDGKIQTATVSSGQIYVSTDYGNTWTAKDSSRFWGGVSMSSDGKIQTAVVSGGQIYVSTTDSYIPSGKIGLGTASPVQRLHVVGLSGDTTVLRVQTTGGNTCDFTTTTGTFSCASDERLKNSIQSIAGSSALQKLKDLNPVLYHYNWQSGEDPLIAGFIAQEYERVFPELTSTNSDGYKMINQAIIPYIVKAIQELDVKVAPLADLSNDNGTFGSFIRSFLGSAANGIEKIFAKKIETDRVQSKEFCIDDATCLTESDIRSLINMTRGYTQSAPTPNPVEENISEPSPDETPTTHTETPTTESTESQ